MLLIFLLHAFQVWANEFSFHVSDENELCMFDILNTATVIVGTVKSVMPTLRFRILFESEDTVLQEFREDQDIQFEYTTMSKGKFLFCFQDLVNENEVFLDYKTGGEAFDKSELAQKSDLHEMGAQLNQVEMMLKFMKQQQLVFAPLTKQNEHLYQNLFSYSLMLDGAIVIGILCFACCQVHLVRKIILRKKRR